MARRGSTKALSVEQEDFIAATYDGRRSRSSGAADNDAGDVRSADTLFECKMSGSPAHPVKLPTLIRQFEKIAIEAYEEGKEPALALRYYAPDSILANRQGYIDLMMRRVEEDAERHAEAR